MNLFTNEPAPMTVGQRIRLLRISRNITQKELAQKINVSRVAISHYENDNREPNLQTLNRIASVFGVSLDVLAGEKQRGRPEFHPSRQSEYEKTPDSSARHVAEETGAVDQDNPGACEDDT